MQIKLSQSEIADIIAAHISEIVTIPNDHEIAVNFGYSYDHTATVDIEHIAPAKVAHLEAA